MATKNYDNFDFDEYQRNLNKSNQSGNRTSYDNYDFDDAYIRQNLPKINEYLTSSINSWKEKNSSLFTDFQSRFGSENTAYRSDASDWYKNFKSQTSELQAEAEAIRQVLDQYKEYLNFDSVYSTGKALDSAIGDYGSMTNYARDDKKYWSQWDSEEAYKEALAQEEEYRKMLDFDIEAGKTDLEEKKAKHKEYVAKVNTFRGEINQNNLEISRIDSELNSYVLRTSEERRALEQKKAQLEARNKGLENYIAQIDLTTPSENISNLEVYINQAKRAQYKYSFESVADKKSENYDPDFAKKSQYIATDISNPATGITDFFGSALYESINNGISKDSDSDYKYLNEQEIAIYNYHYNTEGSAKAKEYLDSLEETLTYRRGAEIAEGKDNAFSRIIFGAEAGLDQAFSGIKNLFSDEDYIIPSAKQVASGIIREDLADSGAKLPDWLGGSSLGQVGYDFLNTTSNMLPSILASTVVELALPTIGEGFAMGGTLLTASNAAKVGKVVGATTMGMSAAGHGKAEMLNLGYSKEQANAYGLMVGAAEAGMEYLLGGITKLGGTASGGLTELALSKVDNALARTAIKIGGSMGSEALEEGLQTIIEPWLKELATGVDWEAPNVDEVLYSSLLGALSAFGLEGAGVVAGEVKTYNKGKTIRNTSGGVGMLQDIATNTRYFSADTVAYKIASKVNAQTDAYTIGRLLNEVGGSISEQNVSDIANGLTAKGMDSKTANKLARQYQAILNADMNISDEAKKILNNIPGLNSVLRENLINKNTTVYQRTKAYSDLMTLAEETANNKKGKTAETKVDSLESLARSVATRGVDGRAAGVMAQGIKSDMEANHPTSSTAEVSPADAEIMQRIASEVASGRRISASDVVKRSVNSASEAAAERLGVEGKYTSSETGATRLASNRKKVNIVGVDSIEDGNIKLKLDDGTVVSADDIDFSSSDEALVYEAVTNMGVSANTAWEILKGYDPKSGQSGTIYAMGALEAYTYGHNGIKVDGMSKDGFSALLSPTQKNTANRLGDIDAMAKVNAQQKTIDKAVKSVRDEAKSKHKAIPKRKGEVVFEGDHARLTDLQKSQVDVLGKMAEGLGVTFHIFESDENFKYTMPNGAVRSANGWYEPKTGEIWIDLKAGDVGQGTIIFTAAHELTHFIKQWSPAKFKVFADFLMEQYGKKGETLEALINRRISDLAAHGRTKGLSETEIYDLAYEEIVADSTQTFLRDSKAAEKIAALREKDVSLANKIKTFLGQMLAKMRKILADNEILPESQEAKIVSEMTDSIQKLYDLWTDALADAGEAYSTVGGEIDLDGDSNVHKLSDRTMIEGAGLQFIPDADGTHYTVLDAYGNAVDSVTPEMIANSPLGQLVSSAKDNGFLGEGKMAESAAKKQYEFLAELVNMCINYDGLAPIWETAGTMVFSSIKSNADKQYGLTIDFSTVCKKTQAIVDAMSEAMVRLGRGLTRSEVETIYLEVGKAGESTPCPVCYVFSRWMGIGGILDQMSRFQDKYTNMSERELQSFIADIKKRISERANTPNKKGELKKDFFDKNGAIKEGQVIADLKQKANSGAGSTLNAITKNSDTQLQIQELKALMENQDAKEAKKTATKIKKLEAKLVDVSALEKQFKEYNDAVEEYEAYQWLTRTLMEEVDGEWHKNKKFKPVPKDVLFDLNKGATFAEDYPLSWAFRTGKGASAGKAITPYADARVGEAIQGVASQDVKNIKTGIDLNPFLNGDEKTRQKIIASAIEKQARQNLIGGQRYQSTSDFRYEYGSDYLITFLEMQAIGAKVQLYTKVIEAVDFLASMGADINLSVMPLSDGYVTLPNGKKKLIYSSVTGIDAEAAIKKAHEYNNVQLILVGISDEHIRLALEGDDVTFVIPFHGSGNSVHQIQALMNLLGENLDVTTAEDYTPVQSDHVSPKQTKEQKAMWDLRVKILTGKASTLSASELTLLDKNAYLKDLYNRFYVNENADEFGINLSKDVAEQIFPYEYWDKSLTYAEADKNGEKFKEYCASMGIIPRFSGMNSKGENVGFGDFTNNKGYWKLLIDRPMYDNTYDADGNWTGYGKYHEQKRINCSNFQVKHLDPEYGSATYGEVMSKANDPKKTNMIVDRAIAQFEDAKFSDRATMGRAKEYFGTTTDFEEAGFILPSGEMLRFTDDKHRGERQYDHRAIGIVYGEKVDLNVNHGFNEKSNKHLEDFVENGGIRFDPGSFELDMDAGMQLSESVPLTSAQERTIRDFIEWKKQQAEAYNPDDEEPSLYSGSFALHIDFGASAEYALSSSAKDRDAWEIKHLTYEGGQLNADRIISDIRHYYQTGETRQQSLVAQFHYSDRVTDKKTLDFLENQEHVTVYRAMQVIDGKLYPPMNAYTYDENGKKVLMPHSEIGAWEQSIERPDLIDPKTGKFKLDKGKVDSGKRGTAVPAAYNPYIHTSLSMLNDQFTSAYQRSNLVVVKGVVPKSELTSGYHAQYAKDSVGETEWHSGVVSTQLPKSRKVILSRWFKPVEIISNDDVAESIKEMLAGTDIEIPYNVVSPGLRRSLEKIGVPIGEGRGIKGLPKKGDVLYYDRDSADSLLDEKFTVQNRLNELWKTRREIESSKEYNALIDRIVSSSPSEMESAVKEYNTWMTQSKYGEIVDEIKSLETTYTELNKKYNEMSERIRSEDERKKIEESGLSESEYFRKQAINKFGYTPFFYDAGYLLPNGKLLNFSGEKGKHFGSRGQDHRAIETIYANVRRSEAMLKFMSAGNIRVMAETPGLDISSVAEPTSEQYSTIRKFAREYAKEKYLAVDITDESGDVIGTYYYENNINADRVVNDIKYFFANGTMRPQSSLSSFLYSDRSPSAVSTRTLLANALETTAQNDIERNKLEQYKSKIGLIESEYDKLTKLKAEIKELSFAKGKRDTARIKDLQFQANQTANRINTYDRQLLNLESTTALKNVLQREKELARKKEAQKGKDALAKYKEKAAKTQRELMDRNTESRKKAIEGRNKTEMRGKIKKVVGDLKALLLDPTKDKHVPIGLQKSVAEALDVINMDTMGADERVAKYDAMIAKANDPDIIAELKKSRDRIALQGANLSDKLTALKQAYAEIKNSDDSLIRDSYNEAIEDLIANTAEKVGNTSLRDMSYEQLEAVYDMYKAILATVRNANKLFKANIQEIITDNSEAVKREVRAAGGHRDRVLKATKFLKKFGWNMLKPIYAMKLIGSDTLTRLYENVRKGEDTWAVDVNEAKDFFKETAKKYEYNVWDFEKQYKFADSAGHTFSLTLEQIMSLYAYSKRSQADKHLEVGGFIFDDAIEVKEKKHGITLTYEVNDADPYRLKKEDLARIIDLLESQMPNVKGFVDEMQAYLSDVMGAKGNEVSLAMYDIKLYKEQNYFPLKTAKYFREFDPEKNGTPKIKNSGFSKKTVPQAGNPIILSNFMDVWANHVNDMSMYHAFVLPLEDFMRVYNYSSTAGGYDSVQQYIKNAYGSQANTYIETLMNDLNGGARTDPATDLIGKGMSLFKKAAVFASASVVIQQPSAIARALAYVDAKYFVDKPEATKHSETWAEVKKYAPVAIIKEMGYFDTNMGRSTVDWIKEEKTWRDKVDDIASKAPALADELAWCAIWKAVKREVASTTKLTVGSEAYLKAVGQRFTEVVTKTQVYDSVLSRSALMRSKDSGAKMVTAFMAEPTTSLNMVVDAIIEGKRGNKKFAGKVVGAVATSIILNSILVSLVTAARDDDEDETYLEKYLGSLTAELLDGFNPLTYIPLVKDIWSIMQGYDIERSDMSIWSDMWQSVENLFSDNKSGFEKTEGIVGSIASIFGLPAKNLIKDARAIYNLGYTMMRGTPTTWAGIGDAVGGAVKDSIPLYSRIEKLVGADESKSDKLYDAIMSGDQKQIDRVKAQYKDDKAVESAIRQALRDNDPRIKEAAQARYEGDIDEYKRIAKDIISEGNFSQDTVVAAINAEINAIKKGETSEEDESDDSIDKVTSIYKASDINSAFESGDTETALEVIEDLINTKVENYLAEARAEAEKDGKRFNERTARKEAESKAKSSIRSSMTSYWKPRYKKAYRAKDADEQERIKRILKDSGMYGNASEVIKTIREWRSERD